MKRVIIAGVVASTAMACEPDPDDELEPPGTLEYEHPYARIHRQGRRVDAVLVQGDRERRVCGVLTERAHSELEDTLAALEPKEDYGYDPDHQDCTEPPGAWVHIEGFEHSPFACAWYCCRSELSRAALIYSIIESNFSGGGVNVDGEPYVAIEPDQRCP